MHFPENSHDIRFLRDGGAGETPAGNHTNWEKSICPILFGLLPNLVMVIVSGRLGAALRTNHLFMHAKRALFGVGAMPLWFSALKHLQMPDAMAISYAMPLTTLILTNFKLQEVIRIYQWSAVGFDLLFCVNLCHGT